MTRSDVRRDERGSGPVTALLVLAVLALLLGAGFVALGSVAAAEGSQAQQAADAAALGGAQGIVDDLPTTLAPGFGTAADVAALVGGGRCAQQGRVGAARLAAANGAQLTSYCWDVARDEVSVEVVAQETGVDGPPARAGAEAATTFEADDCALDPAFQVSTPPPVPSPSAPPEDDDDDAEPPAPPQPRFTVLTCGVEELDVRLDPVDLRFRFAVPGQLVALADSLEPRLTG